MSVLYFLRLLAPDHAGRTFSSPASPPGRLKDNDLYCNVNHM